MPADALQQTATGFFELAALALAVTVEARVIRRIARDGGQVRTDEFRMPDALVALVLATFFAVAGLGAFFQHTEKSAAITVDKVLPGALVFLVLLIGVAGFLRFRGLKLTPLLGLNRLPFRHVAGWALGLVLTAFAPTAAANALTAALLRGQTEAQSLVQLFRTVAERGDGVAMLKIVVAGAVLAPICEEFLFRGFFYAVGKRYLGPLASGFVTALLFAAIHQSLTAFAGLFVLAVCLTLAYERTGSLLVPIGMHALYNFTSLLFIWLQARGIISSS